MFDNLVLAALVAERRGMFHTDISAFGCNEIGPVDRISGLLLWHAHSYMRIHDTDVV